MISDFADRVRRTIERHELLPPGSRVVVALSGGPDSMALTAVLRELAPAIPFTLVGLAHLNHQLRGAASEDDEAFCRRHAERLALPIRTAGVDVRALARTERRSIEDAARLARYRFLGEVAIELGADRIAVGHTRDDQAETMLLRLFRGSGPRGFAGIFPRAGRVVRPLLDVEREEVLAYLDAMHVEFREDESNADLGFARNRIRHELLPSIKAGFAPAVGRHLAHAAEIFRADTEWLDELTAREYARLVRTHDDGVAMSAADFGFEPLALQRRLILQGLRSIAPGRHAGFDHVERILALAQGEGPRTIDVPGVRVERRGADIVFSARQGRGLPPVGGNHEHASQGFRYELTVPGGVAVAEAACDITAERTAASAVDTRQPLRGRSETAVVSADELNGTLVVRSRRPGDRLQPLGLRGHKKLQDIFVDHKIARSHRDRVPIVVDDRDRIVWVAGLAIAEDFRVTTLTRDVVILKLRRWSETG